MVMTANIAIVTSAEGVGRKMSQPALDESSSKTEPSRGDAWRTSGKRFTQVTSSEKPNLMRNLRIFLYMHPGRLTLGYFALLIVLVTALLMLPISTKEDSKTPIVTALFTAVSALSTSGLPIVDTTTHWTLFGQAVILLSVQMGGLGVMTFASMIALAVNRHIRASQRLLTAGELGGTTSIGEVRGVLNVVVATTLTIQAVTFVTLFPGLWKNTGGNWGQTLWQGLFFSVISYNNAGFTPNNAELGLNSWSVGLPIMLSAFCGTLGFPVILNLARAAKYRIRPRRWRLHTKLTLVTTFGIVLISLIWFVAVEWDNPFLFEHADTQDKLRSALSASVMPRTSGFDRSWLPQVSEPTKVFMSAMMFIGGGSTSTAGGIKVTTFAVVILMCRAVFLGRGEFNAFRRQIPARTQMTAVGVTTACFFVVFAATLALMLLTGATFADTLFDACSAFGLGGYSLGVARADNPAALLLLAAVMVVGRIGPMTIAYAINKPTNFSVVQYPSEPIVVG